MYVKKGNVMVKNKSWKMKRKRMFEIIEVGYDLDLASRMYDFFNVASIIINIIVSILYTYESVKERYGTILMIVEGITVVFFAVDYILRLLTAKCAYPRLKECHALRKYMFSFNGIVDMLSFIPYFLPFIFPKGTVAFRMLRIIRIFRLFRINAYYDSLSVIKEVLNSKKQQLISSVFIILVFMISASLCMYSLEHEAQPDKFKNAFSGIWWAASTLLTVGYGDIYPITTIGKMLGIVITFLGVGMVAIPTGIISAGFVDQYTTFKKRVEHGYESEMHFIKVAINENDKWCGLRIADFKLPEGIIIAAVKREEEMIIPRGDIVIEEDDVIILGAEPYDEKETINLKEIVVKNKHPWNNKCIKNLDISRNSVIVLVKRKNKALIPNGNMFICEGDRIYIYTKTILEDMNNIEI